MQLQPNDGHTHGRLRVTSDPPTSCIYRGSKGHISKDRVLIIDPYDPCLPIDTMLWLMDKIMEARKNRMTSYGSHWAYI